MGDELRDAAAEEGQEEDLAHAGEAVPDVLGEGEDGEIPGAEADDPGGEDAEGQRQEDVDAEDGERQHQHVGHDLQDLKAPGLQHGAAAPADDEEDHQGDEGRRQGDVEVHPELILQGDALGLGGGDGGVRDHGEVVAEHGAPGAGTQHHGHAEAALAGKAHGDGHKGRDGAHRRARGGAQEGGDHEHARNQQLHGDDGKAQVDGGVHAAHALGHGGEGARQDVDHQHGEDVLIGGAPGEDAELLIQLLLPHTEGGHHGQEHGGDGGELVEGHLHPLPLQEEAGPQVDDDEDKERQQCPAVGLAVQTLIHGFASSQFSLFCALKRKSAKANFIIIPSEGRGNRFFGKFSGNENHFPRPLAPAGAKLRMIFSGDTHGGKNTSHEAKCRGPGFAGTRRPGAVRKIPYGREHAARNGGVFHQKESGPGA